MNELQFLDLIEAVCRRPGLYTPTGTFYESVSFLEGLASGHLDLDDYAGHSKFTPFRTWLSEKLGRNRARFSWNEFRNLYDSDTHAFAELPKLYREYITS